MMIPSIKCSMLYTTDEEVKAIRQVFGLTEEDMQERVDAVMEWLQKQPHLVHLDISRTIVNMMIIIGKGSIERTKEKIDNFYKYRSMSPELFQHRKHLICSTDKIWDFYTIVTVPKLHENRRIAIVNFEEGLSKFDGEEYFRKLTMLLDLRMIYDYMAGDIWIVDFKHVGWAQIIGQNPLVLKKIATFFTKALNWRIYGIHVLNIAGPAHIVQRVIDFFKQFISSVIMDRVVVHDSLEDMYKYVPRECLPEDYGGNQLSTRKLTEIAEDFYKHPEIKEYLLECSKMTSNESLRPKDENSEDYLPGSFRQLQVD
ncbi:hypothetical protein PYW07_010050 [Mythimna separata]|uniref:CRAL-TRIO domain-containing protein n=1 Tax=Mythimna separata TaxID=271217 RepID=A0AAD7YHY0_MYTSE|nr:hypothetical protein PYW07_010050 [Mythimna separata]